MFWEILKASKGLPVDDPIAALWGQKMSGGWAVTELTGELPLTFLSDGGALKNYRVYGTAGGSGTATGSGEPAGYKIPLTVTSGNLWNKEAEYGESFLFYMNFLNGAYTIGQPEKNRVLFIPIEGGKEYEITFNNTYQNVYTVNSIDKPNAGVTYKIDGVSTFINHGTVQQVVRQTDTQANWLAVHIDANNWEDVDATIKEVQDYPIYIGSTKLEADEYVDYGEQKVYKRTENLFDKDAKDTNNGYGDNVFLRDTGAVNGSTNYYVSEYIEVSANSIYTISALSGKNPSVCQYDANKDYIIGNAYESNPEITITTNAGTKYIRVSVRKANESLFMITPDSTAPSTYIPYLQPTDPPAPLPAINTYKGENTLSSTETVGSVTIRGRIKEST